MSINHKGGNYEYKKLTTKNEFVAKRNSKTVEYTANYTF